MFVCPFCYHESHHPEDELHQYCNHCGVFVEDELRRLKAEKKAKKEVEYESWQRGSEEDR